MSPKSDLTLSTDYEGLLLKKSYRKNSSTGQLQFDSSLTRGTKDRVNGISKKENRGHLDINFANKVYNNFIVGGNLKEQATNPIYQNMKFLKEKHYLLKTFFWIKTALIVNYLEKYLSFRVYQMTI